MPKGFGPPLVYLFPQDFTNISARKPVKPDFILKLYVLRIAASPSHSRLTIIFPGSKAFRPAESLHLRRGGNPSMVGEQPFSTAGSLASAVDFRNIG